MITFIEILGSIAAYAFSTLCAARLVWVRREKARLRRGNKKKINHRGWCNLSLRGQESKGCDCDSCTDEQKGLVGLSLFWPIALFIHSAYQFGHWFIHPPIKLPDYEKIADLEKGGHHE